MADLVETMLSFVSPGDLSTVFFYGRTKFCCKSAQVCVTRCKYGIAEIPSVRNAVRRCESERQKNLSRITNQLLYQLSYRSLSIGKSGQTPSRSIHVICVCVLTSVLTFGDQITTKRRIS
jgi:hypothetical protein